MNAIKYLVLITMLPVSIATAEDKNDWMREAIAKERTRAQESVKNHSNTERLEEKFGSAKEKQPDLFAALMAANKKAAEAWTAVLRKAEDATNPDALAETKQVASTASADVYLAEMTLRYAGYASDRKGMMDKTRDRDVAGLISKLDANEKAILLATRTKNDAQTAVEKLSIENRTLSNELRKTYDEARKKDEGKDQGRDHDKERREKERAEREKKNNPPNNDNGGGGVLGR
jgi:hypothetical protein